WREDSSRGIWNAEEKVRIRKPYISQGILRINGDSLLIKLNGFFNGVCRVLIGEKPTFQIELIGFSIVSISLQDRRLFFAKQLQPESIHHGQRDLILKVKDVLNLAIV